MAKENPLERLKTLGQSVWLDFIQRSFIASGELNRLIDQDGIAGLTSNPTIFASERFTLLQAQGANLQRPLWGSTGTKNPSYPDVLYVEELIGPHTVNTMPPATLAAFRDHGNVRANLEEKADEAVGVLERLSEAGINLKQVTAELESEGVQSFSDSFGELYRIIERKRAAYAAI
jgi:transaldolase